MTRLAEKIRLYAPTRGFFFNRPLVLFQSDDWGLVGVRDQEGWNELRAQNIPLGANPYDYHSLETADDLRALFRVLSKHHDARGEHPSFVCNFITANVDFARVRVNDFQSVELLPLADGLPGRWQREGLLEAYREGIEKNFLRAGFHGLTHFCLPVAERTVNANHADGEMLRVLYRADTSILYGHTRWLSYEYRDDEAGWLAPTPQQQLVERGVNEFQRAFGMLPVTACAPGYRANSDTLRAWRAANIQIAQNGPGTARAPHWDSSKLLMLYRNVSLEPAIDAAQYGLETALRAAAKNIAQGKPVVVSMHAVNFHSTLRNNRDSTLSALDAFLTELERAYPNLLYTHDQELLNWIQEPIHARRAEISITPRWQASAAWVSRWQPRAQSVSA